MTDASREAVGSSTRDVPAASRTRDAAARPRRTTGRAPGEPHRIAYLFLLPGALAYAVFTLFPVVQTVRLSFYDWDGITAKTWHGLGNYDELVHSSEIRAAFIHSFELILFYAVLSITIALFLTALMTHSRVRFLTFFRAVLFMPQTIATVVVAQAFTWIYAPIGPLNSFLRNVGAGSFAKVWLGDFTWALPAVGLIGTWISFGLVLILLLAGAQRIPPELYEAARVDGAGFFREFLAVTLPGIRNELLVAATLTTITALRNFDIVYNTTSGGPAGRTEVPSWLMFENAFQFHRVGLAAAIATVLTLVISAVALGISRFYTSERA
ncbi:MAG: carbohydrate ABC transporter permease [Gaiellaceae bacterium]